MANQDEATAVTKHYLDVLHRIRSRSLPVKISVKLTQLEQSSYVDRTLYIFQRARLVSRNVGVCVQAYLRRTEKDAEALIRKRQ